MRLTRMRPGVPRLSYRRVSVIYEAEHTGLFIPARDAVHSVKWFAAAVRHIDSRVFALEGIDLHNEVVPVAHAVTRP